MASSSSGYEFVLLPVDRAGEVARAIRQKYFETDKYEKIIQFMNNIQDYLFERGYEYKDDVMLGRFTETEVKFLKTLYEKEN